MTLAFGSSVIRRFLTRCGVGPIVTKAAPADRAKETAKITVVPFVPSHSAFCRRAEALMLYGVPFVASVAVLAIILQGVI